LGGASADGDGAGSGSRIRVSSADPYGRVGDANWVEGNIRVARVTRGDMGAGGADAGEGAVILFRAEQDIRRVKQADIIRDTVNAGGLRGLFGQ